MLHQVCYCFTMKLFILSVWVALIPTFVTKRTYQLIIPRSQEYTNDDISGTILSYSSKNVEYAILSSLHGGGLYFFYRKNQNHIFIDAELKTANWNLLTFPHNFTKLLHRTSFSSVVIGIYISGNKCQ